MKKVVRITESDIKRIVNKVLENTLASDFASKVVMGGLFGDHGDNNVNNKTDDGSTITDKDVINKAKELGVTNGEWTRNQTSTTQIGLFYKKLESDKQSKLLTKIPTPKNLGSKLKGTWSISNNKLTVK